MLSAVNVFEVIANMPSVIVTSSKEQVPANVTFPVDVFFTTISSDASLIAVEVLSPAFHHRYCLSRRSKSSIIYEISS